MITRPYVDRELPKSPNKFVPFDKKDLVKKSAKIEEPIIYTLNTLRGRTTRDLGTHWLFVPKEVIKKLGMRITYSRYDFEVIVRRKK